MAGLYHSERRFGQTPQVSGQWGWLLALGILMVILGGIALWYDVFATFITITVLGILLTIGGVVVLAHAIWTRHWQGFLPHVLLGLLYLVLGILILKNPLMSALSLTMLIASFFIVSGLFRGIAALVLRFDNWGWLAFSGLVTFLLGVLIWMQWPLSGLFILGLFVGIDLLIVGWSFIMLAISAKNTQRLRAV